MLRFGKTKEAKEEFYSAKKPIKVWDVNVDNIVIPKLIETQNNSKYLIGYLDEAIRPLVLLLSKTSRYGTTFKDKSGNKRNNKLMSLNINYNKLL